MACIFQVPCSFFSSYLSPLPMNPVVSTSSSSKADVLEVSYLMFEHVDSTTFVFLSQALLFSRLSLQTSKCLHF